MLSLKEISDAKKMSDLSKKKFENDLRKKETE